MLQQARFCWYLTLIRHTAGVIYFGSSWRGPKLQTAGDFHPGVRCFFLPQELLFSFLLFSSLLFLFSSLLSAYWSVSSRAVGHVCTPASLLPGNPIPEHTRATPRCCNTKAPHNEKHLVKSMCARYKHEHTRQTRGCMKNGLPTGVGGRVAR